LTGHGHGGFPQPYVPGNIERFEIKEDIETGQLYFTFDAPYNDAGFFVGARIYRQVGSTWEFMAIVNETVSSVRLAQDVEIDDTTIYYDNSTMTGSFPSQGIVWIENELMYYHGIDTTNHTFTNVVRGWLDTDIVEHLEEDDLYIKLRSDATVGYTVPDDWVGTTQTFIAASFTIHGLTIGVELAPSESIDIIGYGVLPYFPESLHIPIAEQPELDYLFETLGLGAVLDETERIFETLGLGETTTGEVIIRLFESLGLGDAILVTETLAQLFETLGLDDTATVSETLTALSEDLGLGDDISSEVAIFIYETLGIGDDKTVSETLAQIIEDLDIGVAISEEIEGAEEEFELVGFGLEGGGVLMSESSEIIRLEEDNQDEQMMILNNNML
jgi:hypothetical protein